MANTIYFNSLKGKRSKYGVRISGKAEDVINEIRQHMNAKGYINLELKERQSEGKFGQTHYLIVDTYGAQDREEQPAPPPPPSQQGWQEPVSSEPDDLPF